MNLRQAKYFLILLTLLLLSVSSLQAKPTLQDARDFPETGFSVDNDVIWEYFQSRGGVDTFGYPVSELFDYRGFDVQIFQRHVLQVYESQARPQNLLDPEVMPINSFGGLTFPEYDQTLAASAPAPDAANYGEAVREHLEANVPEMSPDHSVGFLSYYLSAAPADAGNLGTLLALEVWGFPTSQPKADPNNENFIYQRFQRGIMHYDASSQVTRGILLGDAFKEMIGSAGAEPTTPVPTGDSPEELIGNTQVFYAVKEAGQWALKSWPDESLLSDPIFDRFYGEVTDLRGINMVGSYISYYYPMLSPNGRYLLLPGIGGREYQIPGEELSTGLWLVDLVERTSRQLLPQAQAATWNPSSDQITYVEEDTLYTLNILSQDIVPLFTHPDSLDLYADWSPDGKWIAVKSISPTDSRRSELAYWAIPTNGEPPRQVTSVFIREHRPASVRWSPDSQALFFEGNIYRLTGEEVLIGGIGLWVPNKRPSTMLSISSYHSRLITVDGQEVTTVVSGWAEDAVFSKDGQRLAYFLGDYNSRLKVFELDENKNIDVAPLTTSTSYLGPLFWNADSTSLIYQHTNFSGNPEDYSSWIVAAEANQSPIELFSGGVLVGVVPMPTNSQK